MGHMNIGSQFVTPFGQDQKVWPCWRKYVSWVGFEVSKAPCHHYLKVKVFSLIYLLLLFYFLAPLYGWRWVLSVFPANMPAYCHVVIYSYPSRSTIPKQTLLFISCLGCDKAVVNVIIYIQSITINEFSTSKLY